MSSGQVLGIAFIFIMDALIAEQTAMPGVMPTTYEYPSSSIFIVCVFAAASISIMFYDGKMLRYDADSSLRPTIGSVAP
jgi:hypothetical protein